MSAARGGEQPLNMELTEDTDAGTYSITHTHSMDCTINNHLPVCPEHLHQGYSLKIQVSFCFHFYAIVERFSFIIMYEVKQ